MSISSEDENARKREYYNGPNWECPECKKSYYGWRGDKNICDVCQCDLIARIESKEKSSDEKG